jgi:hypothetical protein
VGRIAHKEREKVSRAGICIGLLPVFLSLMSGCARRVSEPVVLETDVRLAEPAHWYAQPPTATVTYEDFDALWYAADAAVRARRFVPDRQDRRQGVLTTEPLVSRQWFEPWRADALSSADVAESSLATTRRTVRFEIERRDDGGFALTPKVLIERYAQAENRLTNVVLYRSAFRATRVTEFTPVGTRERDRGVYLPSRYWYATGRDPALEQALANDVQKRLEPRS